MANRLQRLAKAIRMRVGLDDALSIARHVGLVSNTMSGARINTSSSLALSAVYACTYKISSTLAGLSLELMERDGRRIDLRNDHRAYMAPGVMPNDIETPFSFWETIVSDAVLSGCGYARIYNGPDGYADALEVIPSMDVQRVQAGNAYAYKLQDGEVILPENMLEICNLYRKSPIELHRENLGLSMSAQEYGAQYFANGGQMTGVLSSEQPLKNEQMEVLQSSWNNSLTSSGTKLLPFGFRYQRISIAPEEAQFIETRKFQAEEICRIFSVPPALIQLESQTTYNNVEQQNLMFARHTVAPWAKRIEQELNRKLLTGRDRASMFFRFNLNDLHRADMQTRASYYNTMLQAGVLNRNEVRASESMNPVAGGDVHTVQVNQIALDRLGDYSDSIINNNGRDSQETA